MRFSGTPELCVICRDRLGASSASIILIAGEHRARLCASDERTATLEDLQFTTGLGPTVEGCRSDGPVAFDDLRSLGAQQRWPTFAEPAAALGVHSGVAYPLRVGAARLGVLTLYFEWTMSGDGVARANGLAMAETVTQTILAIQAGAPVNELADGLAAAGADRAEVHQASGIIAVQLGIGIAEALVRLRSHAYGTGRAVGDVAADVIAHRLRIER
jgi:hypothetical protein